MSHPSRTVSGFSNKHYSLVLNARHFQTGYILPQYNVVFDDIIRTVVSLGNTDVVVDYICNQFFEENSDWYTEEENEDCCYRRNYFHVELREKQ